MKELKLPKRNNDDDDEEQFVLTKYEGEESSESVEVEPDTEQKLKDEKMYDYQKQMKIAM